MWEISTAARWRGLAALTSLHCAFGHGIGAALPTNPGQRIAVGATTMRMARKNAARQPWMARLLERKPVKIAAVALANKTARIAWAVMPSRVQHHECQSSAADRRGRAQSGLPRHRDDGDRHGRRV